MVVGVALVVLLLVVALYLQIIKIPAFDLPFLATAQGALTLSATPQNFVSNDPQLNGEIMLVTMQITGNGESATAVLSPEQMRVLDPEGRQPSNQITIKVSKADYFAFPLSNHSTILQRVATSSQSNCQITGGCGGQTYTIQACSVSSGCYLGNTKRIQTENCWMGSDMLCANFANAGGAVVELEPINERTVLINVTITLPDGTERVMHMSNTEQSDIIPDIMAVELGDWGSGVLNPPTYQERMVALFETGQNTVLLKSKPIWDRLQTERTVISYSTEGIYSGAAGYNALVNSFKSSTVQESARCTFLSTTATQTQQTGYIYCTPSSPATIPTITLRIRTSALSLNAPVGSYQILSVTQPTPREGGTFVEVCGRVKNNGEGSSVDARIYCALDITPVSQRVFIGTGQEENVCVDYELIGAIQRNCNFTINDVRRPDILQTAKVNVSAYPICQKQAISANHEKIFTNLGCQFVCKNYYTEDVFESTCSPITKYDRCIDYQIDPQRGKYCTQRITYANELKCYDYGKYTTMDNYLDGVFNNQIPIFLPEDKSDQNLHFVASNGEMQICNYMADWGYEIINGVAVPIAGNYIYDEAKAYQTEAGLDSIDIPTQNLSVPSQPTTPSTGEDVSSGEELPPLPEPVDVPAQVPEEKSDTLVLGAIATLIVLAAAIWFFFVRKR